MLIRILIFTFLLTPFFVIGQNTDKAKTTIAQDLSVKEFRKKMQSAPGQLIDVRTPGEVKKGAIANSINIDLFDDQFEARIDKLDKTKPVYLYCASGGRSGEAMEIMNKKGFKEVYNLAGGYSSWQRSVKD